jgi:hypothetical protein
MRVATRSCLFAALATLASAINFCPPKPVDASSWWCVWCAPEYDDAPVELYNEVKSAVEDQDRDTLEKLAIVTLYENVEDQALLNLLWKIQKSQDWDCFGPAFENSLCHILASEKASADAIKTIKLLGEIMDLHYTAMDPVSDFVSGLSDVGVDVIGSLGYLKRITFTNELSANLVLCS